MTDAQTITIPKADYDRLVQAAECDEDLHWCEACGAWLDINDPALSTGAGFLRVLVRLHVP